MVRIIVAGTRTFNDYELLKKALDLIVKYRKDVIIISGTAKGADKLGERYALEREFLVHRFFPDWDAYGKGAGYIRNNQMVENGDMLVVFWDGISRGTAHMINTARKHNLVVYVVDYVKKETKYYPKKD